MSNKVQKTLTAALTATIATGAMAVPAMAVGNQGNVDDLYKAAFEATVKTQDLGKVTQADINAARTAIDALRGTAVESAVPTFSSIVDKAQQQFLTVAYTSIVECQKTETQKDINTARTNIASLPAEFKNAYSTAIDTVQQKKIDATVDAAEAAKKSLKAEDIKKAQALLDELNTVTGNDTVKNYVVKYDAEFKKTTETLIVEKVEVVNNNTVRVQFNREVKDLTAANFEITPEKDQYDRVLINEVKLSEDKKSAEVTTFDAFENKGKYTLSVKDVVDVNGNKLDKATKDAFTYESAEVATIGFTTANIPTNANLTDYIIIKDKLGRDVTNEYKNDVKFQSTTALVDAKGKVSANEGKVMVSATLTTKDITVESKGMMLTITQSAAASFDESAIVTRDGARKFSDIKSEDKAEYVTVGKENDKLVVSFKDQFGKELDLANCNYTVVKNYNPDVVIVKEDRTIVPVSEGTGYVKVKAGKVEKTIAITVKAEANAATIKLEKDSLKLATSLRTGVTDEYTVKDQYLNKVDVNHLEAKVTNQAGEEANNVLNVEAQNGKVTITPVQANETKEGLYTVTLTYTYVDQNGEDKTVTKNLTVDLVKAGDLESYSVEVGATTLDVNGADDKDVKKTTALTVYSLDENKDTIEKVVPTAVEIKDKDGNNAGNKLTYANGVLTANEKGTYTIKVKVGTFVAKQLTIKVENTLPKATTVNLTQSMATVKEGTKVIDAIKALKPEVIDQFGAVMENAAIANAKYVVSAPENVNVKIGMFENAETEVKLADGKETGSFELVIKKVTVNGEETKVASKIVKINVVANYAKRAQEAGAKAIADLQAAKTIADNELKTVEAAKTNLENASKAADAEKKTADEKVAKAKADKETADKGSNVADQKSTADELKAAEQKATEKDKAAKEAKDKFDAKVIEVTTKKKTAEDAAKKLTDKQAEVQAAIEAGQAKNVVK